jgi:hypothetical protein
MSVLEFLAVFVLFMLISSLVIVGWFLVTRGEKVKQPDGSYKREGKIFKGWQLYWERIIDFHKIYFINDPLKEKFNTLKKSIPDFQGRVSLADNGTCLHYTGQLNDLDIGIIEDTLGCKASTEGDKLLLYNEEPEYYWPMIIRYPMSQCPPCMSSIGGTMLYWPFIALVRHPFYWAQVESIAYIFFWLTLCVALSALNKMIYNRMGRY